MADRSPEAEDTQPSGRPSSIPLLIFDGRCDFCRAWVDYWKQLTGDRVRYVPFEQAKAEFPDRLPKDLNTKELDAVRLLLPDREVRSSAQAALTALSFAPNHGGWLWAYERLPLFAAVAEGAYRVIAAHRNFAMKITRLLWGMPIPPKSYSIAVETFLRALGLIYFIAFLSFGVQAAGLIGSNGISPVCEVMQAVQENFGAASYRVFPTVLWFGCGDRALAISWILGIVFSVFLLLGRQKRVACVGLFLLYLSLVTAGQVFMGYQWDGLLLEAGFLAIFLGWSPLILFLFHWLLFRLMFMSGAVKLFSGDPTWRNSTALGYHWETQPLPTPPAWYVFQLPEWFQRAATASTLAIELAIPFLIFFPRRVRFLGAVVIIALQILIFITGNYTFFNLLTISLCLLLFDDAFLSRFMPRRLALALRIRPAETPAPSQNFSTLRRAIAACLAALILLVSVSEMTARFLRFELPLAPEALRLVGPFNIVNSYGLFAVMTTSRPEITIEGSNDAEHWLEYSFKYKAGDLKRRLPWAEPHQPRLDWQMWFAALGNYRSDPWILRFSYRLLQASPAVLDLMDTNPFPSAPPLYLRAMVYEYHFTNWAERKKTGALWRREVKGYYLPPLDLGTLMRAGVH
ncbi:MAG TPA: lipase maturation factor family protein [Terriglobales bacterium]|nr:lipase maturation factor family protein [Terriglobales bacterium]